ncbi:MAG: helix-turn-helix transcriptional regulator [Bacteroidetes bacterium]|nr:helix-turn-helix transcriptional regulator [Bacteroidota bacterium]
MKNDFVRKSGDYHSKLSILKKGKAKAVRFTTLDAICKVLYCQPSDNWEWQDDEGSFLILIQIKLTPKFKRQRAGDNPIRVGNSFV